MSRSVGVVSEVGPGLLTVDTSVADGKAGVIAGTQMALAVDAGIDDAEGAAVLAAATSLRRSEIRLAYTHGHIDHTLGSPPFRGSPIHARAEAGAYMRTQLEPWAERRGVLPGELDASLGWPTEPFEGETSIDLGDRVVRLIDTPGHAPGSVCIHDPGAGVLFGGDTVVTAIPPAFFDGDGVVLAATLRRLAALDCKVLIPGHGDVVIGRRAVRAAIEWAAAYLERCHDHVEARTADPDDVILASAPYERFIGDHLPRERHHMERRHENTLKTFIAQRQRKSN